MSDETWKPVPGYGGYYEASSLGRIRAMARTVTKRTRHGGVMTQQYAARVLRPSIHKGYERVHLGFDGRKVNVGVHDLVLLAFAAEPVPGQICRHLNGNRRDNRPGNLAWGTHLENMADRKAHGNYAVGEDHHGTTLSNAQVLDIYASDDFGVALAARYGVSERVISSIRRGTTWQEITGGNPRQARDMKMKRTNLLDMEKARAIRTKREAGFSAKQLAAEYGVSQFTVFNVLSGRAWRDAA